MRHDFRQIGVFSLYCITQLNSIIISVTLSHKLARRLQFSLNKSPEGEGKVSFLPGGNDYLNTTVLESKVIYHTARQPMFRYLFFPKPLKERKSLA